MNTAEYEITKILLKLNKISQAENIASKRDLKLFENTINGMSIKKLKEKYNISEQRINRIKLNILRGFLFLVTEKEKSLKNIENKANKLTAENSMLKQTLKNIEKENKKLQKELAEIRKIKIEKGQKKYNLKPFTFLIKNINFSTRTSGILHANEINNLGELMNFSVEELKRFRNLGSFSLEEIQKVLKEHGLKLKEN